MAGYSGTPLVQKLGIKPGHTVCLIDAPKGFEKSLEGLPTDANVLNSVSRKAGSADVLVVFCPNQRSLQRHFDRARKALRDTGGLWIAWPKKSSGVPTDLTESIIRDVALAAGLVDNKVCAIDQTWSGLRVVVRVKDRMKF